MRRRKRQEAEHRRRAQLAYDLGIWPPDKPAPRKERTRIQTQTTDAGSAQRWRACDGCGALLRGGGTKSTCPACRAARPKPRSRDIQRMLKRYGITEVVTEVGEAEVGVDPRLEAARMTKSRLVKRTKAKRYSAPRTRSGPSAG